MKMSKKNEYEGMDQGNEQEIKIREKNTMLGEIRMSESDHNRASKAMSMNVKYNQFRRGYRRILD